MNRLLAGIVLSLITVPALANAGAVRRFAESQLMLGDTIEHVVKTPYAGLYEVDVRGPEGRTLYYVNPGATLIFSGQIIDARSGRNLTEERLHALSAINWRALPFKLAITTVHGTGKLAIAVFSDPNCPFCRRFEKALTQLRNITVYTFLDPILEPSSVPLARAVWCSKDRAKAWHELMLHRQRPAQAPSDCNAPITQLLALGKSVGVTSTPTWYLQDGARHQGAVSREALLALIRDQSK